jgi:hypothetical protein
VGVQVDLFQTADAQPLFTDWLNGFMAAIQEAQHVCRDEQRPGQERDLGLILKSHVFC